MIPPDHFADYSTTKKTKRTPKAKSLHSPYEKLTPILTEREDGMDMAIDEEVDAVKQYEPHILQDSIDHCVYCQDVGSYIWTCTSDNCGIKVCVGKDPGDHGCIDASPDEITGQVQVDETNFQCPKCYRAKRLPLAYTIRGYAVRQEFIHRNYFPLLAVFLSWSGFGREYAADVVRRTLLEHFYLIPSRLRLCSRKIKGGNNRPNAVKPDFDWLANLNYNGNLLVFIDTHSDTVTGDLVVSGNANKSNSVPIHELLENYMGTNLLSACQEIQQLNNNCVAGPYTRGIVLCSCGSTGRVDVSVNRLKRFVDLDIFDFVLSFAGVYTVDALVVPALARFVENVFIYDIDPWTALVRSFGEDKHALNSTPVMLSFAQFRTLPDNTRERVIDTRVLAYSNFPDARPWGLDMYRCCNISCGARAHDMTFHADGKQFRGKRWLETKMKTTCFKCKETRRKISAPSWVHACSGDNLSRVWYKWPLSLAQRMEIGIIE